jgi:hypothetical protein
MADESVPLLFVGIDVAKGTLDVALRPGGEQRSRPNTDEGIGELVTWRSELHPI